MLEVSSPRVASPIPDEHIIAQLKDTSLVSSQLTSGKSAVATADMADQINPPLVDLPVDSDIPINKIYGVETPTPDLYASPLLPLAQQWCNRFNRLLSPASKNASNASTNTSTNTSTNDANDANVVNDVDASISVEDVEDVFLPHGSWKDHLSLTWDLHQFHGSENIANALAQFQPSAQLHSVHVNTRADLRFENSVSVQTIHPATSENPVPIEWCQVIVNFSNKFGTGVGLVRLVAVNNTLKALSVFTGLDNIFGNEENIGQRRPEGVNHGQHKGRTSWLEKRQNDFTWNDNKQPPVLIVGGGQGGLNTAARLKMMGIDCLIVEKNPRIGDNWRNRYKFLVLHDPVWYDHLAYLNFPPNWPVFTPKDKLGDWFDQYADSMELSYWTNKTVCGAHFDDNSQTWSVKIVDNDSAETTLLKPRHLIMATGHSGEPNVPHFKNEHLFKGKIVHSSQHSTGKMFQGENAIVLGCCNSGHDIAQDFYEQGAKPIIVQRSSTCVINSEIGLKVTTQGLYEENGPPVEIADLILNSMPMKLMNLVMQQQYRKICELEKPLQQALTKAGFKIDAGYGGTGLFGKYFRRGGGYYIDVGCSKLIADGKISMRQGVTIDHFTENGVVFTDGSEVNNLAIVVLATGYSNMRDTARRIFGDTVADKLNPVWGLDEEGEFKTMWRESGHPNFYYMGGNLAVSRYYSKRLALRIVAKERGYL